jgi:hypothetical protein
MTNIWTRILEPDVMPFMVGTVAIVSGAIIAIVKMVIKHHERITMIQHGIHPDYPPETDEEKQKS